MLTWAFHAAVASADNISMTVIADVTYIRLLLFLGLFVLGILSHANEEVERVMLHSSLAIFTEIKIFASHAAVPSTEFIP